MMEESQPILPPQRKQSASNLIALENPSAAIPLGWAETILAFDLVNYKGPFFGLPMDVLSDFTAEVSFLIASTLFIQDDMNMRNIGVISYSLSSVQLMFTDFMRFLRSLSTGGGFILTGAWLLSAIGALGFIIFSALLFDKRGSDAVIPHMGMFISCMFFMIRAIGVTITGMDKKGPKFYLLMPAAAFEFVGTAMFTIGAYYIWIAWDKTTLMTDLESDAMGRQLYLFGSLVSTVSITLVTASLIISSKEFKEFEETQTANNTLDGLVNTEQK